MNRRKFLTQTARAGLLTSSLDLAGLQWAHGFIKRRYHRFFVKSVHFPHLSIPENKRIPLSWHAFGLSADGTETTLTFDPADLNTIQGNNVYLRLTAALDFREELQIKISVPAGRPLGVFDIKYAHPFQPFDFRISKTDLPEIVQFGIAVSQLSGQNDSWFFSSQNQADDNEGLQPQLLCGAEPGDLEDFDHVLYSMNSFATFGWIGGCVIDALLEEYRTGNNKAYHTLQLQLSHFLDDEKGIIFENPHTVPIDGDFNSIEDFLPMAAIVKLYPEHTSINKALDFLMRRKDASGLIRAHDITTEGCYTVAYPLAAIAAARREKEIAQIALDQVLHRTNHLTIDGGIYQRKSNNGTLAFRNWSRGAAWYFLGTIKTIAIIENEFKREFNLLPLRNIFEQHASWVLSLQRGEGLWSGFLDRREVEIDTSASAGIATAFVLGYQQGILDGSYVESARRCYRALQKHLSPDGFLRGVSQLNRGGETLQESNYRVMSQFGLGLMAQLRTALGTV